MMRLGSGCGRSHPVATKWARGANLFPEIALNYMILSTMSEKTLPTSANRIW